MRLVAVAACCARRYTCCFPITFSLSAGQRADSTFLTELLEKVRLPGRSARPRKRSWDIVADKVYDSDALRRYCIRYGMRHIIPQRRMHRRPKPGLTHQFDQPKYRQRNVAERRLGWLKENASSIRVTISWPVALRPQWH